MRQTDESKIITACINFASEHNLDYTILRYPTLSKTRKIEIDLGTGNLYSLPDRYFGASFATEQNGNLRHKNIHVYPLTSNHLEETENLRLYLEKQFPNIKSHW